MYVYRRIIELIRLGEISEILSPTYDQNPPCPLDHGIKCHILSFLENLQGLRPRHLPGQTIPMSNHSLCEEIPPEYMSLIKEALVHLIYS